MSIGGRRRPHASSSGGRSIDPSLQPSQGDSLTGDRDQLADPTDRRDQLGDGVLGGSTWTTRACELAVAISEAQRKEILEMNWLIDGINRNGPASTREEAQQRPVPEYEVDANLVCNQDCRSTGSRPGEQ